MNKKKLVIAVTAAAMVLTATIGGTLAFFTDQEAVRNTITMGNISIGLEEKMEDPENPGQEIDYKDPSDVKPGDEISKIPYVTNTSEVGAAYIRVLVKITNPEDLTENLMTIEDLEIDTTKWDIVLKDATKGEWYCYLKDPLAAGDTSPAVFTIVNVPEKWGNEVSNKEFFIDVTAEAIQADNFTPTYDDPDAADKKIVGWFYNDDPEQPITVENYVAPGPGTTPGTTE